MITFVFIACRFSELLQNFSRNPSRLSKAATKSHPRCGDVSGPVMTSRFCSPHRWWKRYWYEDCIRALTCKALCGLSRSDKIGKVIEKNCSCWTAASYKVSIAQHGAFFTLVESCVLYSWECPWARWSESCVLIGYPSSYPLGISRFYLAQDKRLRCEDLQSL